MFVSDIAIFVLKRDVKLQLTCMVLCVFQSLVIWSALPIICLLLTLVIFLFYFCVRCCQRDSGHRKGTSCLKCWMVFFVLLAWYIIQIMHFSRKFGIQIWCSKLEMSRQELDISMEEHHIYFKSTLNNRFVSYLTKILTSNDDMQVGLGPGHIVLDGDPAIPKGAQPPIFGPCLLWPNRNGWNGLRCHFVWR